MRVTIHLTSGSVDVASIPGDDALALLDEFERGDEQTLRFALDDTTTTAMARRHVVRIDVDEESAPAATERTEAHEESSKGSWDDYFDGDPIALDDYLAALDARCAQVLGGEDVDGIGAAQALTRLIARADKAEAEAQRLEGAYLRLGEALRGELGRDDLRTALQREAFYIREERDTALAANDAAFALAGDVLRAHEDFVDGSTHHDDCYHHHAACLARRVLAVLAEREPDTTTDTTPEDTGP